MIASEQNASCRGDGWVDVGSVGDIDREDVMRFDPHFRHARPMASTMLPTASAPVYAHLANGLVMGNTVECPKPQWTV